MVAPIITNKALQQMVRYGLLEENVMDVFKKGIPQVWSNRKGFNSVRKYHGYEIGIAYFRDDRGIYKITSVWKRGRR